MRLSLVPYGQQHDENILKKNVIKFVCYGHDTRPHETRFGDCKHPCDARPGCEYQSGKAWLTFKQFFWLNFFDFCLFVCLFVCFVF